MKAPAALGDLPQPLYFFDGYCVLCSGFVAFCLARDPEGQLKFASAQSAVLRSLRHLRGPVRWLQPLLLIPAFLRDPLYDLVARNRYRWFGRRPSCFVPTPQTRDRFIDL